MLDLQSIVKLFLAVALIVPLSGGQNGTSQATETTCSNAPKACRYCVEVGCTAVGRTRCATIDCQFGGTYECYTGFGLPEDELHRTESTN